MFSDNDPKDPDILSFIRRNKKILKRIDSNVKSIKNTLGKTERGYFDSSTELDIDILRKTRQSILGSDCMTLISLHCLDTGDL